MQSSRLAVGIFCHAPVPYRRLWLWRMSFYMALRAANMVLQNPRCALERIVDCKLTSAWRSSPSGLCPMLTSFSSGKERRIWTSKRPPFLVMLPRALQHDATGGDPAETFLKLLHMPLERCRQCRLRFHSLIRCAPEFPFLAPRFVAHGCTTAFSESFGYPTRRIAPRERRRVVSVNSSQAVPNGK